MGVRMSVLWKRHDIPGHEFCRLEALERGWRMSGTAVFSHGSEPCRLDYEIRCDPLWTTLAAVVRGWVGDRPIDAGITRDAAGHWTLDGRPSDQVANCVDIDLNFSPSTNLLPIRRLGLEVGESATVRAAWLRFPGFALEPLEQTYTRLAPLVYRYESAGGRFVAVVGVDDAGLVTTYGEIWSREDGS